MNAQVVWQGAHRAEQLARPDVKHADLILTLTARHKDRLVTAYPDAKDKVLVLAEYASGTSADIEDAWGKPIDAGECSRHYRVWPPPPLIGRPRRLAKKSS
jgi:protein-tyrosine-phosphatase